MWIWKRLLHSHWRDEVLCHYKSFSWNPLCFSTRPVRKFFSWLNFGFEQLAHKPNFKRCLEGISSKKFGILTSRYLPRNIGSAVSISFAVNVLIFFKDLGFRIFLHCTALWKTKSGESWKFRGHITPEAILRQKSFKAFVKVLAGASDTEKNWNVLRSKKSLSRKME